jgi:3-deoxy-manno-octulosonate cytidylyltransferase (CMP-KDO synthetase)
MNNGTCEYLVVIPARFESRRLPGKALLDIHGKPLLQRVWERAVSSSASSVLIATDHARIEQAARDFGAEVIMTSEHHSSGSDRIAECVRLMDWPDDQLIVNLQGDEPLMPAECLQQVARLLAGAPTADAASLYWPIAHEQEVSDPNVVKVVVDRLGSALMFSRAVLPFPRDHESPSLALEQGVTWLRHLGLYAYRAASLRRFSESAPTPLEQTEHLEQLRYLETGGKIVMEQACRHIPAGVDTPEDLQRMRKIFNINSN